MIVVSLVSFSIAAFLILENIFRKSDFFSPARIYFFFQSMALGVAFLAFDKAMTPFKPLTSLVYFGSTFCFLMGTRITGLLLGSHDHGASERESMDLSKYNWKIHLSFATVLFAFFLFGTAGLYMGAGGFPVLAKDKTKVLFTFLHQPWIFLHAYTFGGVVLALFAMAIFRPRRLPKILAPETWIVVAIVAISSLALQRTALIFFVFFTLVFYNNAVRRLSMGKLIRIFLPCLLIILVTGYFKAFDNQHRNFANPKKAALAILKIPYMYLGNGFWNLDYALNPETFQEGHPTTYGFTVSEGVWDGIVIPGGIFGYQIRDHTHIDDPFNVRSTKVKGWNVVGYQWPLYKDFGLAGVLLGPFLIGIALNFLYHRMRRRTTMLNLAAYSFFAYWLANSYLGSIFESPAYTWGFLYLCACCYFGQRFYRPKRNAPAPALPVPQGA